MLAKFATALAIFAASASGSTTEAEGRILVINGNYKQPKSSRYGRSSSKSKYQQQGSPIQFQRYAPKQQYQSNSYGTSQSQPHSYPPQHSYQQPSQYQQPPQYHQPAPSQYQPYQPVPASHHPPGEPDHLHNDGYGSYSHVQQPAPAAGSFGAHTLARFAALEDAVEALQAANALLIADVEALEESAIVESAYEIINPGATEFIDLPADGDLKLADWCAEGPGVVKVRAAVTLEAANEIRAGGDLPLFSLLVGGVDSVDAFTFDSDGEDTFGIEWAGEITDSTSLEIWVRGADGALNAIRPRTAWVSYELYPSTYPFSSTLPAACAVQQAPAPPM